MGRPKKDRRFETLKESLISRLVTEKEPKTIIDLLVAYNKLIDIMEHAKSPKKV